jgi:hypothetical protein
MRALAVAFAAGVAALMLSVAVGASASGTSSSGSGSGDESLLDQTLAPSMPDDASFHGVNPGGVPWVLDRGEVRLSSDDELDLRVEGLVIPRPAGDGTAGGVKTITTSLFCGADTETEAAETSRQVRLTSDGDARIRDREFEVPDTCLSPVILVHPNANPAAYIAVNGWR